ncbi:CMRF35-like molecule 8 [Onychostoma macrolepis]|uniref:CMRF35-like molecule 8 n=1 Tax=Onychostoma macrolepis TaxID=369639 RepID=UPI00272B1322|nr:CMRF35-like molecule 8 [Onychostoma macrolepis]XP_058628678.1 CMRF35-like molecule 8 [Onychostoma macrolepis]
MKIIWTFTLLMIPGVLSSISVTGYSGGGVRIRWRYDRKYTENAKYFCRGQQCTELIRTNTKNEWVDSGRFSLYDDTTAEVFTVTIRDLSEWDSGTYYCAADISWYIDSYTEVNLKVITGQKIRAAEWTHVGRFSVHDDRSARLLRVFIRELNVNDSGEYKIIVKVSEDYSFFSEFHLNMLETMYHHHCHLHHLLLSHQSHLH